MPARNRLSRSDRLTRATELAAVRRAGARIRVDYLDVRAIPSTLPHPRVGFVVAKYSHSAVQRNQLKRRLRELVRTRLLPALRHASPDGGVIPVDVVVRALPTAYGVPYETLAAQIDRVCAGVQTRVTPGER